jgi:hypothetical protein
LALIGDVLPVGPDVWAAPCISDAPADRHGWTPAGRPRPGRAPAAARPRCRRDAGSAIDALQNDTSSVRPGRLRAACPANDLQRSPPQSGRRHRAETSHVRSGQGHRSLLVVPDSVGSRRWAPGHGERCQCQ